MKSIYVYELPQNQDHHLAGRLKLDPVVRALLKQREKDNHNLKFRELKLRDEEVFQCQEAEILELSYSYIASVSLMDPKSALPALYDDLRFGFLWLNGKSGWVAICAKDEKISTLLANGIEKLLGVRARPLPLSKDALSEVQEFETMRRASFYNAFKGTTKRFSNPDSFENDHETREELKKLEKVEDRPSSSYNEELSDGKTMALGFSNSHGKFYFQRELKVQIMRQWGPFKVETLVEAVRTLRDSSPQKIINTVGSKILKRLKKEQKSAICEIASGIWTCRENFLSEIELQSNTLTLSQSLKTMVHEAFRTECNKCQGTVTICCPNCHRASLKTGKDENLICESCKSETQKEGVCPEGHLIQWHHLDELLHLIPSTRCLEKIDGLLQESFPDSGLNIHEESFSIYKGRLSYFSDDIRKIIYRVEEIPEFKALLHTSSTPRQNTIDKIHDALGDFKEKCGKANNLNCSTCVSKRKGGPCLQRLLGLWDSEYTPRTHHGHEYADYSRIITIEGKRRQFALAVKSRRKSLKNVTQRNAYGQDIYSQVMNYMRNPSMEVIGICVPADFDEGFVGNLRIDAEKYGKRLVLIGDRELEKIVYSVTKTRNVELEKI